jgi:hypothetical protein
LVDDLARFGYGAFAGCLFLGAYASFCYLIAINSREDYRVVGWPVLVFILFNVLMVFAAVWVGTRVADAAANWVSGPGALLGIVGGVIFSIGLAAAIFVVLALYAAVVAMAYLIGTVLLFGYVGSRD